VILKAKTRGDAPQLARYLLTMGDNEHVRLYDAFAVMVRPLFDSRRRREANKENRPSSR
jgi:hypothetical protein